MILQKNVVVEVDDVACMMDEEKGRFETQIL